MAECPGAPPALSPAKAAQQLAAEVPGDDARFASELEFVQCLAAPHYLNWLAQNRFLEDPAFVAYLEYLQYWKQPAYAQYLIYPHALFFLDLLQSPEFRKEVARSTVTEFIHTQQFRFWQSGTTSSND